MHELKISAAEGRTGSDREPIAVGAHLARLAQDTGPMESWVRAVLARCDAHSCDAVTRYELLDPVEGRRGGALHATLTSEGLAELEHRFQTTLPWEDLSGSELELKLRTCRHAGEPLVSEIVDVEAAWVRRTAELGLRYQRRTLAAAERYDRQRLLEEPSTIRRISIMRPREEPLCPSIAARLDELARLGVVHDDVALEMRGHPGHTNVTAHLASLSRGRVEAPDILLIIASGQEDLVIRERLDTAVFLSEMPCPAVVGFGRGPHGSLLHDVAFSASETPLSALGVAQRMIVNAGEAAGARVGEHPVSIGARS